MQLTKETGNILKLIRVTSAVFANGISERYRLQAISYMFSPASVFKLLLGWNAVHLKSRVCCKTGLTIMPSVPRPAFHLENERSLGATQC